MKTEQLVIWLKQSPDTIHWLRPCDMRQVIEYLIERDKAREAVIDQLMEERRHAVQPS